VKRRSGKSDGATKNHERAQSKFLDINYNSFSYLALKKKGIPLLLN